MLVFISGNRDQKDYSSQSLGLLHLDVDACIRYSFPTEFIAEEFHLFSCDDDPLVR